MANYTNPYDFIQPLLQGPVPNINAGIQTGENLVKLQPTLDNMAANIAVRKAEADRITRANQAYNSIMGAGSTFLEGGLTPEKVLQMNAAGLGHAVAPMQSIQGNKEYSDWYKNRTAPITETVNELNDKPVGPEDTTPITTTTPASTPTLEELLAKRSTIPALNEGIKDLVTQATLEKTRQVEAARQRRADDLEAWRLVQEAQRNRRLDQLARLFAKDSNKGAGKVVVDFQKPNRVDVNKYLKDETKTREGLTTGDPMDAEAYQASNEKRMSLGLPLLVQEKKPSVRSLLGMTIPTTREQEGWTTYRDEKPEEIRQRIQSKLASGGLTRQELIGAVYAMGGNDKMAAQYLQQMEGQLK